MTVKILPTAPKIAVKKLATKAALSTVRAPSQVSSDGASGEDGGQEGDDDDVAFLENYVEILRLHKHNILSYMSLFLSFEMTKKIELFSYDMATHQIKKVFDKSDLIKKVAKSQGGLIVLAKLPLKIAEIEPTLKLMHRCKS